MEKLARLVLPRMPLAVSAQLQGYLVITLVVFIWSGFALSVRAIGASGLAVGDVAVIRFAVPLLLLLPFTGKLWPQVKRLKLMDLPLLLLGGVPFFLLASIGAGLAPTAYVGTVLAGTPGFFVAVLGWLVWRQPLSLKRFAFLCLILAGVVAMLVGQGANLSPELLSGVAILLSASLLWAVYTIALKRSGLSPLGFTLIISFFSSLVCFALLVSGHIQSNFGAFSLQQAMPFILVQGVLVGLLATIGYSFAVRQLGSSKAAVIGSLSPALTALLAVPVFSEPLTLAITIGIALVISGVILSNRLA